MLRGTRVVGTLQVRTGLASCAAFLIRLSREAAKCGPAKASMQHPRLCRGDALRSAGQRVRSATSTATEMTRHAS